MNQPTEDKQIYLLADLACRLAAIDIGSNSVRLLIAEALRGAAYRILDEERVPTRLGRSVSSQGRLDDESMEQTIAALRTLRRSPPAIRSRACGRLPPAPSASRGPGPNSAGESASRSASTSR